ncbi:MAG: response regulator [Verrucomicrobia bacterium]|nr:response regulator [Verrucomicrobiota bacterium]
MNPTTPSDKSGFKAVLLVDDDRQLVDSLRAAMMDENFLVDVASDGEEAFLKAKVHQYDAIVCDLMMPKLRGDAFYRQATELRPEFAERFLFITGYGNDPEISRFLSTVPARCLLKPFTIQELIDSVRRLVA